MRSHQDSNPDRRLRKPMFYPLNYGSFGLFGNWELFLLDSLSVYRNRSPVLTIFIRFALKMLSTRDPVGLLMLRFTVHGFAQTSLRFLPRGETVKSQCIRIATQLFLSPRQESNPHYILRKDASYPLNDEGKTSLLYQVRRIFSSNRRPQTILKYSSFSVYFGCVLIL